MARSIRIPPAPSSRRDGRATHLKRSDFELDPQDYWTSRKTGARYPVAWSIRFRPRHLDRRWMRAFPEQELAASGKDSPAYWEGAVVYTGTSRGSGYLEMTGYAQPMRL